MPVDTSSSDPRVIITVNEGPGPQGPQGAIGPQGPSGAGTTGEDTDDLTDVWTVDNGSGEPIAADAGEYHIQGRSWRGEAIVQVGDDAATIKAAILAVIEPLMSNLGYNTDTDFVVDGDWSQWAATFPIPVFGARLQAWLNASSDLTLGGVDADGPVVTHTKIGHGTYQDLDGTYGDVLGRVTAESIFSGGGSPSSRKGAFLPQGSNHVRDGVWWDIKWVDDATEISFRDLISGTFDQMDVQRGVREIASERATFVNTQAYSDVGSQAVRARWDTSINRDGTNAVSKQRVEADHLTGSWEAKLTDDALTETVKGHAGQSAPISEWQASDGTPVFRVDPLGPLVPSPDGTWHRLLVANDGTVSTTPA